MKDQHEKDMPGIESANAKAITITQAEQKQRNVRLPVASKSLEQTFGAIPPQKRPEDFQELRYIAIEEHIKSNERSLAD
jgi:hypothetical protein